MNINIRSRRVELPNDTKAYAQEKFARLERYNQNLRAVDVMLDEDNRQFHCEAILHLDNRESVVVDVAAPTFNGAIDAASDKCVRQLNRDKERSSERRRVKKDDGSR